MPPESAVGSTLAIQPFAASEAGAWSNAYLISGRSEAILFDVGQLHSEAAQLADMIVRSGKALTTVIISHAHPDHFMGLDVITARFPAARIVSTPNVVVDIQTNGPWMFDLLQHKLGPEGPTRLVVPQPLADTGVSLEGTRIEVVEFGEGESQHLAALYLSDSSSLLCADLVYNGAHLYLQERHIESWLARLDELDAFAADRVTTLFPGHGAASDLTLIEQTRRYLRDFASAVKLGSAQAAQEAMLAKYPEYRVKQFLTAFSVPAYFPAQQG